MVGGEFGGADTAIENGASDEVETPSLTLITMFVKVPMLAEVGAPASVPVVALKLAQAGLF